MVLALLLACRELSEVRLDRAVIDVSATVGDTVFVPVVAHDEGGDRRDAASLVVWGHDAEAFALVGAADRDLGGIDVVTWELAWTPLAAGFQWAELAIDNPERNDPWTSRGVVRAYTIGPDLRVSPPLVYVDPEPDEAVSVPFSLVNRGDVGVDVVAAEGPPWLVLETALPAHVGPGEAVPFSVLARTGVDGELTLELSTGAWVVLDVLIGVDPGPDADGDGLSEAQGDCDDGDPAVGPLAVEDLANGIDDDCDGATDDLDGDGFGTPEGDCRDDDRWVGPHIEEDICWDGEDNDCNGEIDEICAPGCAIAARRPAWGLALLALATLRRRGRQRSVSSPPRKAASAA